MVWAWSFLDDSQHVATVWGTTHGPEVGDYQLYDVDTGRMLAEVFGDEDAQQLKSGAPDWAQDLQAKLDDAKPASRVPLVRKNFLRSGQVSGKVIVPPAIAPDR
jgi:hypothetical protein